MTTREGISVSPNTIKWLNFVTLVLALIGPPAVYFIQNAAIQATYGVRLDRAEHDIQEINAKMERKLDSIDAQLRDISKSLNQLDGKLQRQGLLPKTSSDSHTYVTAMPE